MSSSPVLHNEKLKQAGAASATANEELRALVAEHQAPLLRYAYRLVRNAEQAQDMVQEAFVRYLTRTPAYGEPKQRASWLYKVTHNLCVDWVKRESRRHDVHEFSEVLPREERSDTAAVAADRRSQLDRMLEELSESQRTVMLLFFEEGKSYKEIAEITGHSISNVGMLLHRGLKRLRASEVVDPEEL
jgi:RNA polymerase sigma-70 factor (ECF subfamily)